MRICVVGAGAIGGMLGVKLAVAGHEVTLVARGPHLEAIRARGLRLVMSDGTEHVADGVAATADIRACSVQDLVILGVKAHQLPPLVDDLRTLFHDDTLVLPTQNGIPWWYFHGLEGSWEGRVLHSVDPGGRLFEGIEAHRVIGCVVYPAAEIEGPGVIRHIEGLRFSVGELDGSRSERIQAMADLLVAAGLKSFVLDDVRSEIWLKAWGNLSFNPISALTHATLEDICRFPPSRELSAAMMREAQAVAEALGAHFRVSLERRIAGAESVGRHKTSMLQDVEAGKRLEVEALIGAVVELAEITGVPVPAIRAMHAATLLLDHVIGQEGVRVRAEPAAGTAAGASAQDSPAEGPATASALR